MLKSFCLHMYVRVFVEYVWEGLKWVCFLNVFPLYFVFGFQRDCMGHIGITHPRIGQKWPCTGGGLQLDFGQCRVSPRDEERERVGCYGPLLVSTNHVCVLKN